MIVVICSGGPKEELPVFTRYEDEETVFVGADSGAYHLIEKGIIPDVIVGDFDSVTEVEWKELCSLVGEIDKFQAEKDETDTDLALLRALRYNPSEIIVTGVTGGRLDHYEAVLRSVLRLQITHPEIAFKIVNKQNELRFLTADRHYLEIKQEFPYVSFFAQHEDVRDVTLRGVKYETTCEAMPITSSRFTSNEIIQEGAYIEFTSGICLMIRSVD